MLCPGEVVDLSDYDYNAVASLLKLYLRELPEPLIPQRLLTKMEAATQCESTVCVQLHMYTVHVHVHVHAWYTCEYMWVCVCAFEVFSLIQVINSYTLQ